MSNITEPHMKPFPVNGEVNVIIIIWILVFIMLICSISIIFYLYKKYYEW